MKLIKNKCEICGELDSKILDFHHIIPQEEINSTNHKTNIAIICANCHRKVHNKQIIIYGIVPSTSLPNKRTLIYSIDGIKNLDIEIPNRFNKKTMKVK